MEKFEKIRKANLKDWLAFTSRKRYINDITRDSFECYWQDNYTTPGMHNNAFCSIAEWNTHITDILSETTFDKFDFVTPRYNKALFRYYSRFLLVTSEILTDFQDLLMYLTGKDKAPVRQLLSIPDYTFTVSELFCFINTVCKYKIVSQNSFHCFNNHTQYFFLDSKLVPPSRTYNILNLNQPRHTGKVSDIPIEVIQIDSIIAILRNCYLELDCYLDDNYDTIKEKLKRFEV